MLIREGVATDREALTGIYLRVRRETFPWIAPRTFLAEDFDADTAGERILVAEDEGRLAGFVSLWTADRFVHHLYVEAGSRRRGVGRALLKRALEVLGRPARLKCVIRNARACAFYERGGWTAESEAVGAMGPYRVYALL